MMDVMHHLYFFDMVMDMEDDKVAEFFCRHGGRPGVGQCSGQGGRHGGGLGGRHGGVQGVRHGHLCGSHGLSARRAQKTKSSRAERLPARNRGP